MSSQLMHGIVRVGMYACMFFISLRRTRICMHCQQCFSMKYFSQWICDQTKGNLQFTRSKNHALQIPFMFIFLINILWASQYDNRMLQVFTYTHHHHEITNAGCGTQFAFWCRQSFLLMQENATYEEFFYKLLPLINFFIRVFLLLSIWWDDSCVCGT